MRRKTQNRQWFCGWVLGNLQRCVRGRLSILSQLVNCIDQRSCFFNSWICEKSSLCTWFCFSLASFFSNVSISFCIFSLWTTFSTESLKSSDPKDHQWNERCLPRSHQDRVRPILPGWNRACTIPFGIAYPRTRPVCSVSRNALRRSPYASYDWAGR